MNHTKELHSKRPMSPHLSIYKPQINSTMSIFHRFTGIGLFFGFSILAWWMICWIFSKFDQAIFDLINHGFVKFCLYALVVSFFYHLLNGIRHLFWDIGKGYSLSALSKTSYLVLATTIILSIVFFTLIFGYL
jgi:succinate dehydrogenase / fumarate reductase, cytochrome b subunit